MQVQVNKAGEYYKSAIRERQETRVLIDTLDGARSSGIPVVFSMFYLYLFFVIIRTIFDTILCYSFVLFMRRSNARRMGKTKKFAAAARASPHFTLPSTTTATINNLLMPVNRCTEHYDCCVYSRPETLDIVSISIVFIVLCNAM